MTRPHRDEGLAEPLEKLQRALCAALRRGATRENAAASLGLDPKNVAGWMALAENADSERPPPPELVRFATAIKAAEAQAELRLLESITIAAHAGDVRAAFWLLERRRVASVELSPEQTTIDVSALSDEELEQLARGEPMTPVSVPPGPLTQRDLERMTGAQLVSLVRQGRIMPTGPVIYLPAEEPEA